ncbi:hypothetical protein CR513_50792, partial [Mucuna pruriens]
MSTITNTTTTNAISNVDANTQGEKQADLSSKLSKSSSSAMENKRDEWVHRTRITEDERLERERDHVIGKIVANIQALNGTVLAELLEEIFVEVVEVILDLVGVEGLGLGLIGVGDDVHVHVGPLVHVRQNKSWANCGLRVKPRTPVAVPASADLEVERTVHPVLLRPEYRCQVFRHLSVRVRVSLCFAFLFLVHSAMSILLYAHSPHSSSPRSFVFL